MKYSEIIQEMQNALTCKGTGDIVILNLQNKYFHQNFINSCISELKRLEIKSALGEKPNSLEKLAFILLCDSANIEIEKD